jgi:hypothetical protein
VRYETSCSVVEKMVLRWLACWTCISHFDGLQNTVSALAKSKKWPSKTHKKVHRILKKLVW